MSPDSVEGLIGKGLIEQVESDEDSAAAILEECRHHLASAVLIAESDPNGAYQLLYDAARKAISAHMLASGLRLKSRPGAHETAGRYAQLRIADPAARLAVARFDRIRRNRNRSEYDLVSFSRLEVVTDLAHAEAIVAAVDRALSGPSGA